MKHYTIFYEDMRLYKCKITKFYKVRVKLPVGITERNYSNSELGGIIKNG